MTNEETISEYVAKSVESGVKPLELYFEPIYDCDYGELNSYRAGLKINSIICGTLKAEDYVNANLPSEVMTELSFRAIKKAVQAVRTLEDGGIDFKWLSIKCPSALVKAKDLYKKLVAVKSGADSELSDVKNTEKSEKKATNDKNGEVDRNEAAAQKVCVEFDASVMKSASAELAAAFGDIRSAGMRVAVSGYGGDNFPLEKILGVCPDYLYLDKKITRLASDKEKQLAIAPIVNLAKTLGGEVIVTEVICDEELKEFKARECIGFIPGEGYKGILNIPAPKEYTIKELTRQAKR